MLFRGYLVRYLQGMTTWVFVFRRSTVRTFIKGLLLAEFSLFSLSNSANESLVAHFHRILVFLVKNGLTHVGGGFSASVGEFHIVRQKRSS